MPVVLKFSRYGYSIPFLLYSHNKNSESNNEKNLKIQYVRFVSKPALGPTQPPIQWVQGALSLGVKRPWREADHSPSSNAEVKNA